MIYRNSVSTPVFGLRREIDRLFEDTFGRGDGMNSWTPAVDVRESDNELTLEVELPGIQPEDVEITAENGVLTVRGEKRSERKEGDESSRYHMVERSYGSFVRSFQLPPGLDESKIEASYNDGILSVQIPKTALPQPRKIQIGRRSQNQMSGSTGSGQKQMSPGASTEKNADSGNGSKGTKNTSRQTAGSNA
ncbi:MAG: Hsp20/alpha crystallin family protein [Gemmatimonadaceae bacterium]